MVARLTWLVRRLGTLLVSPPLLAWLGRLVDSLALRQGCSLDLVGWSVGRLGTLLVAP